MYFISFETTIMKKSILITWLSALFFCAQAQQSTNNPLQFIRFIQVTGTAEMEITPDEVIVSITLKEYKESGSKITLKTLEERLRVVLQGLKLPEKDLAVSGAFGYRFHQKKFREQDFYMTKSYELKLKDLAIFDDLVDKLDEKGIQMVSLQKTSHTKIEDYKKQVKVNAVKAAKEKADLMLGALGNTTSEVLEIIELENEFFMPVMSNMRMESFDATSDLASKSYNIPVELKKIKLKQSVQVKFAIK